MSEEISVYQVEKKSTMNNRMRARTYYAAAVNLFQDPAADDCEIAIELLNKAIDLYPDFSEASIFREEVWHCLLKSLDPKDDLGTYEKYKKSPAWHRKRDLVRERDKSLCVCGAQATEMHHKTYGNIGKEPLSDLVMLCNGCHKRLHQPRVLSNEPGEEYWYSFKTYMEENGNDLQLFPDRYGNSIYGIEIDGKTRKNNEIGNEGAIWLVAYRDHNKLQANLCMQLLIHYDSLKKQKDSIQEQFEDNLEELKCDDNGKRIGFHNNNVGNVVEADRDEEFPWLRDRLVKLHTVFRPLVLKLRKGT